TVAGATFYPKGSTKGEPLPKMDLKLARMPQGDHFGNFIACVKSRKSENLNAEIAVGHVSAGLCHLANISYRLGKDEPFNSRTGAVKGNDFASETLARTAGYLKEHGVKLDEASLRVGRKLEFDGA